MTIWIALVGGIIIGWVIEWIIDWLYWRRGIAGFYATENDLRNQLNLAQQQNAESAEAMISLRGDFDSISLTNTDTDHQLAEALAGKTAVEKQLQEALDASAEVLASKSAVEKQLQEALDALTEARKPHRDDLEQIDGIGRVYEQKLFDAGVNTFAQLAVTPVARLAEIIQPASWQKIDFQSWVEQARRNAQVVIFDLLPYRLEEINGIGPKITEQLNAQGIMTFSDLANLSEDRLRELVPQRGGLPHDYAGWIQEAKAFVGVTTGDRPPLPLERIKGIGPVFATKLDLAGIHTYADLAAATETQIQGIIGTRGVQVANFSRWIAEAKADLGEAAPTGAPQSNTPDAPKSGESSGA